MGARVSKAHLISRVHQKIKSKMTLRIRDIPGFFVSGYMDKHVAKGIVTEVEYL